MRKLVGSRGSFAEPKWNSRWLTFCILHPNDPRIDAQNSPRCVSQLEDISSEAFDGEILVDGPHESFRRFENYSIIGIVRNRTARCKRSQSCSAAAAQTMIDRIMMNQR